MDYLKEMEQVAEDADREASAVESFSQGLEKAHSIAGAVIAGCKGWPSMMLMYLASVIMSNAHSSALAGAGNLGIPDPDEFREILRSFNTLTREHPNWPVALPGAILNNGLSPEGKTRFAAMMSRLEDASSG